MILESFRQGSWLGVREIRLSLWLLALLNIAAALILVSTSSNGIGRNGQLLGSDFVSFWSSGQMLHDGDSPYDVKAHAAVQHKFRVPLGHYKKPHDPAKPRGFYAFFYPPVFLPFCYPLGFLGYFPALIGWLSVTGAGFLFALREWFRRHAPGRLHWTAIAAFAPFLITVTHGQTSFLVAAMLGLGALLIPTRPWLAGALIGLAVIKPQLGLTIPLVLLLTGQWRTILAACASAAGLGLLATAAFGPQIWHDWFVGLEPARQAMENGRIGYAKMPSLFAGAMMLGAPLKLAYALQTLLTVIVLAMLARASWRAAYTPALAAAMLAGATLTSPFILDYDLLLLAFPLVFLAGQEFRPWEKSVAMLAFVVPAIARPLGFAQGIPVAPPILFLLFALLVWRAMQDRGGLLQINPRTAPEPDLPR